jgi:hypothetical protein
LRVLASGSFAATILSLGTSGAFAQIIINGTGTVTGTFTPPPGNPNFNRSTTRVDTNAAGQYFRNGVLVYSAPDPSYVGTRADGRHYVDFRGIPVVSTNGTITSDVFTSGNLQPRTRTGQAGTTLFGTVQDEFVARGYWEGIVTDPATGQQYQGVFEFRGQGPRYSDANGGTSPTVFDFGSEYNFANGLRPTMPNPLPSFTIPASGMPVRLRVTVPAGVNPVNPVNPPVNPVNPVNPPVNPVNPVNPPVNPVNPVNPPVNPVNPVNPPVNPVNPVNPPVNPVNPVNPPVNPVNPVNPPVNPVNPVNPGGVTSPEPVTGGGAMAPAPIAGGGNMAPGGGNVTPPTSVDAPVFSSNGTLNVSRVVLDYSACASLPPDKAEENNASCGIEPPTDQPIVGPRSRVLLR